MEQENNQHAAPTAPAKHVEPKSTLTGHEGFFDTYLREKAPFQLPPKAREWIVKYSPWIILVFSILGAIVIIPLLLVVLGLKAAVIPAEVGGAVIQTKASLGTMGIVGFIIALVAWVMEIIAIPKLLKRQFSGWQLVYYATLVSAAGSLISMQLVSLVLGLLIGMYLLFQIRSYYK